MIKAPISCIIAYTLTLHQMHIIVKFERRNRMENTKEGGMMSQMPEDVFFEKTADTFKLISDATRVKVLLLLCHSQLCVSDIASAMDMTSPAVSHHLKVLRQAGILTQKRNGREVCYTLANTDEARMVHHVVDAIFGYNCPIEDE